MTGLGQATFTSIFGYLIGLALRLDHVTALYAAVARWAISSGWSRWWAS